MKPNLIPPLDTQGRPVAFIPPRRRPTLRRLIPRPSLFLTRAFTRQMYAKRQAKRQGFAARVLRSKRLEGALIYVVLFAFALLVGFQAGRVVGCECRETMAQGQGVAR